MPNDNQNKNPEIELLKKQVRELTEQLDVFKLAPRIVDVMIRARTDKTGYNSGSYTKACDVVLDIEWQGRRYRLPAFEL